VVEESDGDLMGDSVNIAARLEGIADPGGICLSEDAYRQVRDRCVRSRCLIILQEPVLLRVAAEVGEGQDYDRKAWWTRLFQWGSVRCGRCACRASLDRRDSHWSSDVLEFFLSEIGEAFLQAITHLPIGVLGKTDGTGLGIPSNRAVQC
jgi:hypothetical protein